MGGIIGDYHRAMTGFDCNWATNSACWRNLDWALEATTMDALIALRGVDGRLWRWKVPLMLFQGLKSGTIGVFS